MYCSIDDLIATIGHDILAQLTSQEGDIIDSDYLESVIREQSNLIDDYLRGRYTLPLSSSYTIINHICVDFVRYELYKRRNEMSDIITDAYKEAKGDITKIQKGLVILSEPNTSQPPLFAYTKKQGAFIDNL